MSRARILLLALAVISLTVVKGQSSNDAPPPDTIKVGILHSLSGFLAIPESELHDAELLAIEEINKAGGVLGKQIQPIIEDPESKFTDVYPAKAKKLLLEDKVVVVFGCWTSVSRKNVLPVFEENNGLLFYPVAYEGNESSKNVVYTGALPNQQIVPAVDWLLSKAGGEKKKFYLLGSDYIYPRVANLVITKHLEAKGLKPVGVKYTPLGHRDYRSIVQDIKQAAPDVIVNTVNCDSNVFLYNELADQKITADKTPVVALLIGESELRGLDASKVQGHLAAWSYFQSVDTPVNKEFVKNYQKKYGKERFTNDAVEAAYFQVYLWKKAVEKAKSTDVDKVREALRGLELEAPQGRVKVDDKNQHTWKRFRMGKIRKDGQFDIVFESKDWIPPDPYPPALRRP